MATVNQAKVGSLASLSFFSPPADKPATKPTPKPVDKPSRKDCFIFKSRVSASGNAVKDQVMAIDQEVVTLTKAKKRNERELNDAEAARKALTKALGSKLKEVAKLEGAKAGAEGERDRLNQDIKELAGALNQVNRKISELEERQKALQAKEAALGKLHREQFREANDANSYLEYVRDLEPEMVSDAEKNRALDEYAKVQESDALERMHRTEGRIRDGKVEQAVNGVNGYFLSVRRGQMEARGERLQGELDLTNKKINRFDGQIRGAKNEADGIRGNIAETDLKIARGEKTIALLESKIGELETMRDELLSKAIGEREQDAAELQAKLKQLEALIREFKSELAGTKSELQDLKELRESYKK